MDIILLERVEKLGAIGDVVTVKDGYARNFLLPNKKALRANDANRKVFEANRAKIESDNATRREEAQKASGGVEGKQIVLIRAASQTGQLYGSVSVKDIVDGLVAQDAKVAKSMIVLERPIKTLGVLTLRLFCTPKFRLLFRSMWPVRTTKPSCRRTASTFSTRCSKQNRPRSLLKPSKRRLKPKLLPTLRMQLKPLQTQSAAKSKLLPRLLLKLPVVCRPRLTKRKLSRQEKQKAAPSQDRAAFLCHILPAQHNSSS